MKKYHVMYDKSSVDAAQEYINKNNKFLNRELNVLHEVHRLAKENAIKFFKDSSENGEWASWSSFGGLTMIATLDAVSKKGYPIINIYISVSPSFGSYDIVIEKLKL